MYTLNQIKELIRTGRTDKFYNERFWRRFSKAIISEQHNECQYCKAKGKVTKATILHHVKHLKSYPELAYSRYYIDKNGVKRRQLVATCQSCHEEQHPERRCKSDKFKYTNQERW